VSAPSTQTAVEPPAGADEDQLESRRRRHRRLFSAAALALVAAAVVIIVVSDPFGGGGTSPGVAAGADSEYPTSLTAILSQPLSSQTQVSAVLGYAGDSTVRLPAGTAPTAVASV
jgi:hypothetical protein